jgi:hypothetical protein
MALWAQMRPRNALLLNDSQFPVFGRDLERRKPGDQKTHKLGNTAAVLNDRVQERDPR